MSCLQAADLFFESVNTLLSFVLFVCDKMARQPSTKFGRKERERRSEIGSSVRPARERPCRRRILPLSVKMFLFASSPSPITECLVGALDWSHHPKVVSSFGGTTRSRGGHGVRRSACMFRVVVPGDGGYHRSVDAGFSPGGGGSFSFADAGSSSREDEVIYALSSSVLAPKGRGSHSSTLSVLVPEGRGSRLLYAVGLGPVVCWVWVLVGFWWKRCYGSCRQGVCSE
ncbi:hypothetical protein YC2023_032799 [Brassica napus]